MNEGRDLPGSPDEGDSGQVCDPTVDLGEGGSSTLAEAYPAIVAFGVLGPLTAVVDGRPLSIGGPIPRRLLAALLARAPHAVPVDVLVDDVWGDAAPTTAVRTLHSHVNRLRTVLGRDQPWALETVSGGYQMVLRREDLDAWVFEDLLSSSEEEGVEPTAEAGRLRAALQLWRGPAYGEFLGTGFADGESTRLEALRELAIEDRVEADLAAGLGPGLVAELETLVAEHPFRERLWAALVVATYRSGRQAEALGVYQRARDLLRDELGVDPGPQLRSAERRVLAQDPDLLASPSQAPVHCPWKGLAAYEPADSGFFVGRERLVSELVARLVDNSVVVVTGPSGSGKSSVVRAGLLPSLAAGAVLGSGEWRCATVTPGPDPLATLGAALCDALDLLVVDQAEEIFGAPAEAMPSIAATLRGAIRRGTRLVLVVRGDMFARLAELAGLSSVAGSGTVLVGAPDPDELRRVVQVPARKVGLSVEPALVEAVVADVAGRPAALPLLSTALVRTWERCDGHRLTMADYVAAGGTTSALERLAEETYGSLDEDGRLAARRILLRLTVLEDGRWARRPVPVASVMPAGDEASARALETLSARRLVTVGHDDVQLSHEALLVAWPRLAGWLQERVATSGVVDHLATSALTWAVSGREPSDVYRGARLQAGLDLELTHPEELGEVDREFLAAGRAEAERELRQVRAEHRRLRFVAAGLVVLLVVALVSGSVAVRRTRDATDAARVADAQRLGLEAVTRGDPTQALLMAVAAVRLDGSPSTESNLLATLQETSAPASTRRIAAPAVHLAMSSDGWLAVSHSDGTIDTIDVASTDAGFMDPQRSWSRGRPSGAHQWLAEPDGLVVGATSPSRLFFVSSATGAPALFATGWDPHTFVVTQDSTWVVGIPATTTRASGSILLARTAATGRVVHRALGGEPVGLAPGGGSTVVVAERPPALEIVDLGGKEPIRRFPMARDIVSLAASPDGRFLASATSDGTVTVIDAGSGASAVLSGLGPDPVALAFSADGALLAGASAAKAGIVVWSTTPSFPQTRIGASGGTVRSLAWAPDGHTLYSGPSGLPVVQVWDVSDDRQLGNPIVGSDSSVTTVTASAVDVTSRVLGVGTAQGLVKFVAIDTRRPTVSAQGSDVDRGVVSVAFADHGRLALTADVRGVLTVWDVATATPLGELTGASGSGATAPILANAPVGPDGRTAASFYDGYALGLFDVVDQRVVRPPVYPDLGTYPQSEVLGWSPDGRSVVVRTLESGQTSLLALVDVTSGAVRWSVAPPEELGDAGTVFTADGSELIVPGQSGALHVLDASTGRPRGVQEGSDGSAGDPLRTTTSPISVSRSPAGGLLATAGAARPIEVWDAVTGELRGVLSVASETTAARFLSDTELVGVTTDGAVQTYTLAVDDWIARACRVAGRELTPQEWHEFLSGYPYQEVCR